MQSLVRPRLEAAQKELLDLGLRNPLISYRYPVSKGVAVTGEQASFVLEQLVAGKAFGFLPASSTEKELSPNRQDLKLQTPEPEEKLQQRLLRTYYLARTTIEEQGVNTLFLAVGMLHWYESDASNELRKAPLMLVPVTLERSTARDKFKITYSGEELGSNLSLQAKLQSEFGVDLPLYDEDAATSWLSFCNHVSEAIKDQRRWHVDADAMALGFFSFGKFLLYHDLKEDSWPAQAQPSEHPLISQLLGDGFRSPAPSVSETAFLDDEPAATELLQAVDADSTQMLAMLAVAEGRNLIIQGPPGTGKSQTITNIIAHALGTGKKVLFVAEKNAALEVVKRRLDAVQLGEASLELHSNKANKKELHTELRRTLELGKPSLQHLQQQVTLLSQHRDEINAYCKAVNEEVQNSGLSAHDLAGKLWQLSETVQQPLLLIPFPDLPHWDAGTMQKAEALATRVQACIKEDRAVSTFLFWGSGLQALMPGQQEHLQSYLQQAGQASEHLKSKGHQVATSFGFKDQDNREMVMKMADAVHYATIAPALTGWNVLAPDWDEQQKKLEELVQKGARLQAIKEANKTTLLLTAWSLPVESIRLPLLEHGEKWYRFLITPYRQAVKELLSVCAVPPPKTTSGKIALLNAISEAQEIEKFLAANRAFAQAYFGTAWQEAGSDWDLLKTGTAYLAQLGEKIKKALLPPETAAMILKQYPVAALKAAQEVLLAALNDHGKAIQQLTGVLAFNDHVRFGGNTLLHLPFSEQIALLKSWAANPAAIHEIISFNNLVETAANEKLLPLVEAAIHWPGAKLLLTAALQKTWYQYLLEKALHTHPVLRRFARESHETVIAQFRNLDLRNLQYNRAKAALRHWEGLPPADAGGQMNLLRNEFNKKARHLPIRKLMMEAGLAIQAIKPVFMMSPLSIANFLPPGSLQFDLVIFDEASQVKPVDGLGAILRGKQLVVVGDSQQLPPTAFFDALLQDDAPAGESFTADLPSILGLCDAQGAPQSMLRWHYRSRHESLIRLSNQEFYENRLVVFPSPGTKAGAGLFYHYLPHTVYDRGQTRTNREEAEAVALAVLEHVRQHPAQSLGVVAFSTSQQEAIQERMEWYRKQQPQLESWIGQQVQEPFFVKNLENVQGDERDVIFISIGYGKSAEGLVSQSFGPLNMAGGEKRLNVLVTRARLRCAVFTNLSADDIDTSRSDSKGLKVLKNFLHFAQHGSLESTARQQAFGESPFEDAVARRLRSLGYQVQQQVGSAGFYLDMAIADPEHSGRYVLGIECDGATYHSARSARDRDRLRQQVLEAMGWRLHRIWSTDWWRDPQGELNRVEAAIEKAWKDALHAGDEEPELVETSLLREPAQPDETKLPDYQMVQLPAEVAQMEMQLHPVGKMAKWVELIVRVEGPVHVEEVARRLVEAAGITRVGPRIKDHLKLATRFAEGSGAIRQEGSFLYLNGNAQPPLRSRALLPPASRKWKYVAPEEKAAALYKVVKEAISIDVTEAYPLVIKLLGFSRVTEEMRNEMLELIPPMVSSKLLFQDGDTLKVIA